MYVTSIAVIEAIKVLKRTVHPFAGITFMACKAANLPVGSSRSVSVDALTQEHLERYHVLDRASSHFFQPFKSNSEWVAKRYASTGLQSVNTRTFLEVFIHPHGSSDWGFATDYVSRVNSKLRTVRQTTPIPSLAMAIWLYKTSSLAESVTSKTLLADLYRDFHITDRERDVLFDSALDILDIPESEMFADEPLALSEVAAAFSAPPDAEMESGGTVAALRLDNIGPASTLEISFGERLSIVTGDNGLGKSFLLDFAWWAATGTWADRVAFPFSNDRKQTSEVCFDLRGESGRVWQTKGTFDWKTHSWVTEGERLTVKALALFSRADGSFALSDPIRTKFSPMNTSPTVHLAAKQVWDGKPPIIEGLIRDWVKWQQSSETSEFDRFKAVLRRLSPEDLGVLEPGPTVRLWGDVRDIPTIKHLYGTVPVLFASSGVQRILLLAYLIIWAWREHEIAAEQLGERPLRRMVVVVDELEAHLHPKWQRTVLPALMNIGDLLSAELAIQTIAATHSPMVLASMEATFNPDDDVL
jgi:hypothetical protein